MAGFISYVLHGLNNHQGLNLSSPGRVRTVVPCTPGCPSEASPVPQPDIAT